MKIIRLSLFVLLLAAVNVSCRRESKSIVKDDMNVLYDEYKVEGSFVLYDQTKDQYTFYNKAQFKQAFTPASTFKICNSLIGLETGVIKDENFIIPWDSVVRHRPEWNADHDLKTAFKNSTVWYYQELARRVGGEKMKYWLDKSAFGNRDTSGGIDRFWLDGGLRVTPEDQISFLKRLHDNTLPFSQRSMDIVKKIMIRKDSADYMLRGKTGWGFQDNTDIGWFVGYVEKGENVYYFANCIQCKDSTNNLFPIARIEIAEAILKELIVDN